MTQTTEKNIAETIRDIIESRSDFSFVSEPDGTKDPNKPMLISMPDGRKVVDLTNTYREAAQHLKPFRRKGTAVLSTLASLIDWANRFKGDTSVLFANPKREAPSLTCIANYHGAGPADLDGFASDFTANHCDHRGVYHFPLSKEWKRWMAISGQALDKDAMAQFIDDNAMTFIDPTPALLNPGKVKDAEPWEDRLIETAQKIGGRFGHHLKLVEMARAFQVFETSNLQVSSNRDSGESTIGFVNEHKDAEGRPLQIPNLFLIAIPVFNSGALYRLPVRFQYRKNGAAVKFVLTVYDPDRAIDDAFEEAVMTAATATNLDVFIGTPES